MAVFIRAKRVTDPLDERVKARLRGDDRCVMAGYAISGSEHEAADLSCFSGLFHALLENNSPNSTLAAAPDTSEHDCDSDDDGADRSIDAVKMLRGHLETLDNEDPFRLKLLSGVSHAVEALAELRSTGSGHRQAVMHQLREAGYDAGLCKAKWESCRKLTAGSYEYIDVIRATGGESERRYIVDLDFSGQFEIARATAEYSRVAEALPMVMVGMAEDVRNVVRAMGEAARRSLKRQGLHLPPWRKTRYMLAKWLGPYHRTTNPIPSPAGAAMAEIKCRAVGFHSPRQN